MRREIPGSRYACPRMRDWSRTISFDHLRHGEEIVLADRRVGNDLGGAITLGDDIRAHLQAHGDDRGHRLDARDIDLVQLLDETKNGVELATQSLRLRIAHGDTGKVRDALDGFD